MRLYPVITLKIYCPPFGRDYKYVIGICHSPSTSQFESTSHPFPAITLSCTSCLMSFIVGHLCSGVWYSGVVVDGVVVVVVVNVVVESVSELYSKKHRSGLLCKH